MTDQTKEKTMKKCDTCGAEAWIFGYAINADRTKRRVAMCKECSAREHDAAMSRGRARLEQRAASRQDVPYLLDLVASLTAERDALRRALAYLIGNGWEETEGVTLAEKAMSTVIDRQAADLAALRAVVKEARAEIESWPVNDRLEIVANEAAVLAILGRGLTGREE